MRLINIIFPLAVIILVIGGILYSVPLTEKPIVTELKKGTTIHEKIIASTLTELVYTRISEVKKTSEEVELTSKRIRTTKASTKVRTDSIQYCQRTEWVLEWLGSPIYAWIERKKCVEYGYRKLFRTFTITEAYNTYVTSPKTTIVQEYIITTPFQETSTQWKQITLTQPTPTTLTIPTTVYQQTTIANARGIAFSLWIIGILIFIGGLLIQAKVFR